MGGCLIVKLWSRSDASCCKLVLFCGLLEVWAEPKNKVGVVWIPPCWWCNWNISQRWSPSNDMSWLRAEPVVGPRGQVESIRISITSQTGLRAPSVSDSEVWTWRIHVIGIHKTLVGAAPSMIMSTCRSCSSVAHPLITHAKSMKLIASCLKHETWSPQW